MDNDFLNSLDDLNLTTEEAPKKTKAEKSEPVVSVTSERFYDIQKIKDLVKKEPLYVIKNIGKHDLVMDWDLELMPVELKSKFDKYLEEQYTKFDLQSAFGDVKPVAILVDESKTVNFLHQFMTELRIPSLETIIMGKEVVVKSQLVIPVGKSILITPKQWNSLKRFERARMVTESGTSDWDGSLGIKEVSEEDLQKIPYSIIFIEDIKKANFSAGNVNENPLKKSVTFESAPFEL